MPVISYLTKILFDNGMLAKLADELRALGILRPLIVTDRGLIAAGLLERLHEAIGDWPSERLFADTPSNPTEEAVDQAAGRYLDCRCDGIIAFGGGSPIDLAKAVALKVTQPGDLIDYAAYTGGSDRIIGAAPVIAVPTTSGTGSEVGRATVIIMKDGQKRAVISPHLVPRVAICDPLLTLGLPPAITAGTGMDAIAHCVETFLSPRVNPPADAIALDGLTRGVTWIGEAYRDGANIVARWQMMMASLQGGLAFQKGLGAVHALSHSLGTLRSPPLHHGTLNAVLLPAVLTFNSGDVGDKYSELRRALGLAAEADLPQWFAALTMSLGLPTTLGSMGVPKAMLPRMAGMAVDDFSARTNPRAAREEDYLAILEAAYGVVDGTAHS